MITPQSGAKPKAHIRGPSLSPKWLGESGGNEKSGEFGGSLVRAHRGFVGFWARGHLGSISSSGIGALTMNRCHIPESLRNSFHCNVTNQSRGLRCLTGTHLGFSESVLVHTSATLRRLTMVTGHAFGLPGISACHPKDPGGALPSPPGCPMVRFVSSRPIEPSGHPRGDGEGEHRIEAGGLSP